MDVDGTMTDGKLYIGNDGEVMKSFNVKDGYAIRTLLPQYNIKPIIITARKSNIVERRCEEIGIKDLYQGCDNKIKKMIQVASEEGIGLKEDGVNKKTLLPCTAYLGDDVPDLECMRIAEISGCPSDASRIIKKESDYIGESCGGNGFIREFVEWLINEYYDI